MPSFNENVTVAGELHVSRPWADWVFLRQERDAGGGGGFVIHNPWGHSNQAQGAASRNRLEIGYRAGSGATSWGRFVLHGPSGNVGIGLVEPQARLHVAGDVAVTGDVVLQGADCAEEFDVEIDGESARSDERLGPDAGVEIQGGEAATAADVEPGSVMVLTDSGCLRTADIAYDRRVAGVVSGAGAYRPGIVLDRAPGGPGDGRVAIALVGKAFCRVDAGYAAVEVGDLLTTSPTPGHAMRAADARRAFGATLGKALRPLPRGTGLVPVLVSLG